MCTVGCSKLLDKYNSALWVLRTRARKGCVENTVIVQARDLAMGLFKYGKKKLVKSQAVDAMKKLKVSGVLRLAAFRLPSAVETTRP